jgi:hypothetical protein
MDFNIFQYLDVVEAVEEEEEYQQQQRRLERGLVVARRMTDPLTAISNREFRRHFRFTKAQVGQLVVMLMPNLRHETDRGNPLTPVQQICIALNHYGGGHFQRISGLCGGISQQTAQRCLVKVTEALCQQKAEHIRMPTRYNN